MTKPEMADEIVREVGHVDILIANLAYPHTYAPAHEKTDADLEYSRGAWRETSNPRFPYSASIRQGLPHQFQGASCVAIVPAATLSKNR